MTAPCTSHTHTHPSFIHQVIKGIIEGCRQSNCKLLGGETAEMPGFYQKGEYDLAGFAVGAVKKEQLIDGKRIKAGDVVLAFPSSGVHSNGFSLVRKVLEVAGLRLSDKAPFNAAKTIGQVWEGGGCLGAAHGCSCTFSVACLVSAGAGSLQSLGFVCACACVHAWECAGNVLHCQLIMGRPGHVGGVVL